MFTFNDIEESPNGKSGRKKSDVAILGVPFDLATTNHAGQRAAPLAIRMAGYWTDSMRHIKTGIDPMQELTCVDAGDVLVNPGDVEGGWKAIRENAQLVYSNTRCLIALGGDHTCTAKVAEGITATDGHPLTIIHFDAHTDYDKHDPNVLMNHGTWVRRVIDDGLVNRVVQFGIRGWGVPGTHAQWATKNDITTYFANQNDWMRQLVEEVADTSDPIYMSIDMDVLDPAFAPGVAYQEPGGITARELFSAIDIVASSGKMVAADVMEVIPDRDPTGITVKTANRVVAQLLTSYAVGRRK